jgi:hypothetical protein
LKLIHRLKDNRNGSIVENYTDKKQMNAEEKLLRKAFVNLYESLVIQSFKKP